MERVNELEKKLELKETSHNGECSNTNWYVDGNRNYGRRDFENWQAFKDEYSRDGSFLYAMNQYVCFRYDIKEVRDDESDEPTGAHNLHLYIMEQSKGKFVPVKVKHIQESDMREINEYLMFCWRFMKGQWSEFSGVEEMYPLDKR